MRPDESESREGGSEEPERTLLLVEDQAIIALSQRQILEKHGFSVVIAHSGEEALTRLEERSDLRLVLMDIDLGAGMDGTETAVRMLEHRDLPIVFLTAHAERDYVQRVEEITSYGYVLKDSGEFVLVQSIKMAFKLFDAHQATREHERQLEEALAQLELGNETAGLGIWQLDLESGELEWNEQMYAIYGVDRERFSKRVDEWRALLHPEDAAEADLRLQDAVAGQSVYDVEFSIVRPDGEVRHLHASARPIYDREGEIAHVMGINMDVTESRRTERALREREAHFRLLTENSADPIALFDGAFNLVYVSPAAAEVFGYVRDDFRDRSAFEILHPEDRQRFEENVTEALRNKREKTRNTARAYTKNGHLRRVELSSHYLYGNSGALRSAIVNIRDVTGRGESDG